MDVSNAVVGKIKSLKAGRPPGLRHIYDLVVGERQDDEALGKVMPLWGWELVSR